MRPSLSVREVCPKQLSQNADIRSNRLTWFVRFVAIFVVAQLFMHIASAQVRTNATPARRVTSLVDNNRRVTLHGHTLPVLHNASDLGRLSGETAMNHLVMVLRASPEQDHALQYLIDQQLDKNHANFHQWMTPEQFGSHFGVADSDIKQVTDWLAQQGFTVEKVLPNKRFIQFSGNVHQVESAFQTQMHRYAVGNQTHVANSGDISIPAAFKAVIAGIPTLHDFFKKPTIQNQGSIVSNSDDGDTGKVYESDPYTGVKPNYTNGSTHFVGAGDFAAIYNTTPLLTSGFDGTGITIGVIGRTDINLGDVQTYREMFGLKNNDPIFTVAGEDPGIVGGDDGESYLDVEVSGGAAPGATINFITARATLTTDGVDLAAIYAVQNNLTDIISESYGQCEANFSAAQAMFYNNLWAQAAAQGQSVFVSSGDNGPASCDNSNNTFSSFGYAVSLLASSPYNVAVGGTLFADTAANWNPTATVAAPFGSALGYIPEVPWNESRGSGAVGASGLWSGSGGVSAYFMTPTWQRGFGVPSSDPAYAGTGAIVDPASPFVPGPHRYLPDVSMAAAAQHDGTLYCAEGICQLSSTGSLVNAGIVGGTSVAAPTMAGVQALIDHVNGGRQGLPTYQYYALADAQHTNGLICAANAGASLDPNCAFHDVTTGNTLICANSACTAANKIGWTAAAGYDLATGLGSPNAANLANLWSTIVFNSSVTTMNLSQTSGITHGQGVTVSGSVAPGAGGGTPTGNVAFIASSGALTDPLDPNTGTFENPLSFATLDGSGNYSISLTSLPTGTYFLTARYGGDGTFASSLSLPIQVTVTSESSGVTISPNAFNGTTCAETPSTAFTYGSYVWIDISVSGTSGQGVPTGTVAITNNGNPLATTSLNPVGVGHILSGAIPTSSCVFGYTLQDTAPLPAGTHLLGATYSGDSNFGPMAATPVTITISSATITGALAAGATTISVGGSVPLNFTLAGLSGAGPGTLTPTGTVTFTDTTTATFLGTATLNPTSALGGVAFISTTGITTAGAHSIQASWPGDNNYNAVNSSLVTVTVAAGTATSVAVTSNANPAVLGGRPTFTATMTPTTVTSGTVNFYDSGVLLGSGTVGAAHTATFRPSATVNLPAGAHSITAVYAGNATFASSTSPAFTETFNPAATTISLTVKNSGTFNENFILNGVLGTIVTATPPSGTITFFDGASSIGSAPFTTVSATLGGFGLYQAQLLQPLSAGAHTITAQLTDSNYTAPTSNSQTITVNMANQTITFGALANRTFGDSDFSISATASSSLAVAFTASGNCTIAGSTVHITDAGSCTITASQTGNSNYNAANIVQQTFSIAKGSQSINFGALSGKAFGEPDFGVSATSTASLVVSFAAAGNCTIAGSTVHITDAGSCTITASQAGNTDYAAATNVPQTFTIAKEGQTITFGALLNKNVGDPDFAVSATSTSGLPVTFTATGSCTVTLNLVHLTGGGPCTITASQAGNIDFAAATDIPQTFLIGKQDQSITFGSLSNVTFGSPDFGISATSSSSLPVTFAASGNCTVVSSTVHITGAGSCTITASQAGNTTFNAATDVSESFSIAKATPLVTLACPTAIYDGAAHGCSAVATGLGGATVLGTEAISYNANASQPVDPGIYTVSASFTSGAPNYNSSTAAGSLTIATGVPVLGTLSPAIVHSGSAAISLATSGTTFAPGSVINWNATPQTTTFVSTSQLTAPIPASNLDTVGTADISIFNPAPGGGTSTTFKFAIDTPSGTNGAVTASSTTTSLSGSSGQAVTMPVTFAGGNSSAQTTLTCYNLPAGSTCTLSGGTVTITVASGSPAGTYQALLVFTTTQTITETAGLRIQEIFTAGIGLMGFPFVLLPFLRKDRKLNPRLLLPLGALILFAALAGCAGGSPHLTPPPQTEQVTSQSSLAVTISLN